jgi:hypothetical protein
MLRIARILLRNTSNELAVLLALKLTKGGAISEHHCNRMLSMA